MGLSIDYRPLSQRTVADARRMSELELNRRMDCLGYLGDQYTQVSGFDANCPFWGFFPEPIVPGEEIRLKDIFLGSSEWAARLVQSASDYDALLENRTCGLTLDDARAQLHALRQLVERADLALPLDLTPRLFRDDKTGLRARRRLEAFTAQIARFHDLAPAAAPAIRAEEAVTSDRLGAIRELERTGSQLGTSLGTPAELGDLCRRLQAEGERLGAALAAIEGFCSRLAGATGGAKGVRPDRHGSP
jgi:hypothetical protein